MHRRKIHGTRLVITLGAVALAGCGTQLRDKAFAPTVTTVRQAVQPQAQAPAAADPADPAATAAPGDAPVVADPAAPAVGATDAPPGGTVSAPPVATVPVPGAPTTARPTGSGPTTKAPTVKGASPVKPTATGQLGASDVGVTATTITLGNIVSAGGVFGAEQFAVSKYGTLAYFADLNTRGGINGRKVLVNPYNDNGDGSQDVDQVKQAIADKDFALVGNNVFAYDGAAQLSAAGMPDIGGQPISNVYYKYSNLFTILGTNAPRDNTHIAYNGSNYGSDETGLFFKEKVGSKNVGIVYYDESDSQRGASIFGQSFSVAGLKVTMYPVNLGLPNFPNVVAQMQSDGVDTIADAMDSNGNAKLCQAMESNSAFLGQVKAKVSSISAWSQRIATEFKQTPKCRNLIYVSGSTRGYHETANPEVAAFRAAMKKYYPSRESLMAQWSFEGWLAGEVFTEAARSCGAALTRTCVEAYLTKPGRYLDYQHTGTGFSWFQQPESYYTDSSPKTQCTSVARWSDSLGTFQTVGDVSTSCYPVTYYKYEVT